MQAESADASEVRRSRLSCCHLSQEPLQRPVVADLLGNLYSKSSLLEFLLGLKHAQFACEEAKNRRAISLHKRKLSAL